MKLKKRPGFILVTVLAIISIIVLLSVRLSDQATAYLYYARYHADLEKARELANGGIALIISQLSDVTTAQKQEGEKQKEQQKFDPRKFAAALLQHLNFWQQILLKFETDGMDGILRVYATCEDGKISIPDFIEATQQKEKAPLYKFVGNLGKQFGVQEDIATLLDTFLKKRGYPLNELPELFAVKEIHALCNGIVIPHFSEAIKESKDKLPLAHPALSELFSLYKNNKISIWSISPAILKLIGLNDKRFDDPVQRKTQIQELLQKIKSPNDSLESLWKTIFQQIYSKELSAVSKDITDLLTTDFQGRIFSVVSYATVGQATHRLYAIVERHDETTFVIKRVYRI